MKKQSLLKGTIILGTAGIFAKFLGLFFRWPLIMLIGDEGIGYYQMSYPLYMFFIAVASGIPVAISKLVSEYNAVGNKEGTVQVLRKALLLMIILGGGFSLFLFTFSKSIIYGLKWDSKAYYSLVAISLAPLVISIMSAFRGFFQGMQNMTPTAISQILEQIGRVLIGVGLAYILLPKGIEYSAGGAAFGAAAGGIIGGLYLILKYLKIKKEIKIKKVKNDMSIMSKLLYIAIPISLGASVGTIMSLIDSIIVPQKLLLTGLNYKQATILYGQLSGKAFVLINIPLTLSIALSASLVPIIAEAYILNRKKDVQEKLKMSLKISMVISIPCMVGLFFMAGPILNLLFPGHAGGYRLLRFLSLSIPFIVLCQTSTSVLQGIGKYIIPVVNLSIGCIVKTIITVVLVPIPDINIYGAIIGTVVGYITAAILNILVLKKELKIKLNIYEIIIKPLYASVIMIICVILCYFNFYNKTINNTISTLSAVLVGAIIYILAIFIFGIFRYSYVKNNFLRIQKGRKR